MTAVDYLVDVLGGTRVFGHASPPSSLEVRDRINQGLPFRALESARSRLGLSVPELAGVLQMPLRTLARRRADGRLAADESDRLYRIVRVAAQAIEVFGTEAAAAEWLRRPNRSLGGEAPLHFLDTDVGTRQVEVTLGRLEHGIPG
jgi:putative toxin-antitoxin system antitoxin component (TIGR02293 family)